MIHESFEWLDSFMKALQYPKLDLGQIRFMLDDIIEKYPEFSSHLAADANIIKSKDFENAVVKIVLGREHLLPMKVTQWNALKRKSGQVSQILLI
jgi:hypothetical protein